MECEKCGNLIGALDMAASEDGWCGECVVEADEKARARSCWDWELPNGDFTAEELGDW